MPANLHSEWPADKHTKRNAIQCFTRNISDGILEQYLSSALTPFHSSITIFHAFIAFQCVKSVEYAVLFEFLNILFIYVIFNCMPKNNPYRIDTHRGTYALVDVDGCLNSPNRPSTIKPLSWEMNEWMKKRREKYRKCFIVNYLCCFGCVARPICRRIDGAETPRVPTNQYHHFICFLVE